MIKCSDCEEPSVYYNAMNDKEYCKEHFCKYFERIIEENMKKLEIVNPKIAVYYSGGKDSAVVLYVLRKILKLNVVAITANLGIKEHFDKILELGKKICKELEMDYYEVSLKECLNVDIKQIISEKNPKLACHYCGELRNISLDKAARWLNVDAVVSGHNRDDITRFLLNNYLKNDLFRITEFASMVYPNKDIKEKINYNNPIQVKPLIYLSEKEITLYCLLNNIEITDACCGYGDKDKSSMQGWRSDLTYVINYLEERYPGFSIGLINNFEKNLLPIFNECALNRKDFFEKRQCVFCKKSMETDETDICITCNKCADIIGVDINDKLEAHKIL